MKIVRTAYRDLLAYLAAPESNERPYPEGEEPFGLVPGEGNADGTLYTLRNTKTGVTAKIDLPGLTFMQHLDRVNKKGEPLTPDGAREWLLDWFTGGAYKEGEDKNDAFAERMRTRAGALYDSLLNAGATIETDA